MTAQVTSSPHKEDDDGDGSKIFFRASGAVFVFAFTSMYMQWPTLYGVNGLLPSQSFVDRLLDQYSLDYLNFFLKVGSIIPVTYRDLGFHVGALCDALMLIGLISSIIVTFVGHRKLIFPFIFLSWFTYLSLTRIGQTFFFFQWDSLLLEFGFLCVVASFFNLMSGRCSGAVFRWTFRFLAFKLMLLSGAVKLQANCPTWNKLTALEYHFATQCLPTSIAWYAHQLPPIMLRFGVAITLLIEIPLTILLVLPIHRLRVTGAVLQILLQLLIFITGNYNYFNILTSILMIPCFYRDSCDISFNSLMKNKKIDNVVEGDNHKKTTFLENPSAFVFAIIWEHLFSTLFIVFISFNAMVGLKLHNNFSEFWWIGSQIALKYGWDSLSHFVSHLSSLGLIICITMAIIASILEIFSIISGAHSKDISPEASSRLFFEYYSMTNASSKGSDRQSKLKLILWRFFTSCGVILSCSVVCLLIALSGLGMQPIGSSVLPFVPKPVTELHKMSRSLSMFNSYGLFRHMTGVGPSLTANGDHFRESVPVVQRPELVIEALHPSTNKWIELDFFYKPGNVSRMPTWASPHQPRLDWQMWFAALGSYENNPYLINLLHKLLVMYENENKITGNPEISSLFLNFDSSFINESPREVRIKLYHYDFTKWETKWNSVLNPIHSTFVNSTHNTNLWWRRKFVKEYIPSLQSDNPSLKAFLQSHGIYSDKYISLSNQVNDCESLSKAYITNIKSSSLDSTEISFNGWGYAALENAQLLSCQTFKYRPHIEYFLSSFCELFANFTALVVIILSYIFISLKG